jgi:hypothetical protein
MPEDLDGVSDYELLRRSRSGEEPFAERTEASARRRLAMSTVQIDDDAIAAIASIDGSELLAFLDDLPGRSLRSHLSELHAARAASTPLSRVPLPARR